MGNSPAQIAALELTGRRIIQFAALELTGRRIIQYTAGGTRGLVACDHAMVLLAGSLVCAAATARYLRLLNPRSVTLVVPGVWKDRDGDEDHACADLIEALLRGNDPPRERYAERLRRSDFGRRFLSGTDPNLPPADLECAAAVDRFDFAMPMNRLHDGLLIRPVPVARR